MKSIVGKLKYEVPVLRTHVKVLSSTSLKASTCVVQKRSKRNYFRSKKFKIEQKMNTTAVPVKFKN